MKPCSHVVCKTCVDTLVRPSEQCVVCDHKLGKTDIVNLKREGQLPVFSLLSLSILIPIPLLLGTGYAGGGIAETSKKGVAFQG